MNCKPGDVALVVRCCGERNCKNLGKMVRCIQIGGVTITGRPVWEIEGLLEWYVSRYPLVKELLPLAPDYCLMPIPPLGDDACSESSTDSSDGSSTEKPCVVTAGVEEIESCFPTNPRRTIETGKDSLRKIASGRG